MSEQPGPPPSSTPVETRLCPNCGTAAKLLTELGYYWFYYCEQCSWSQDDVIDPDEGCYEPLPGYYSGHDPDYIS